MAGSRLLVAPEGDEGADRSALGEARQAMATQDAGDPTEGNLEPVVAVEIPDDALGHRR